MEDPSARRYLPLAQHLEALASPTRLDLLATLRTPRALSEIRVTPTHSREGENPERPLSRQGIQRHLDTLLDAGLVERVPGETRARGDSFVLNHERLFALVDEIRSLARLRPVAVASPRETLDGRAATRARLPDAPRLLVAYGRDDGVAFGLDGPVGARWRIGRSASCEVRLDYDPYLSQEHARVVRTSSGYEIEDAGSRNGTLLNWEPLDGKRALASGDLVTVGRCVLVLQA